MCMVMEYGPPTLFFTLSCVEYNRPALRVNKLKTATVRGSCGLSCLKIYGIALQECMVESREVAQTKNAQAVYNLLNALAVDYNIVRVCVRACMRVCVCACMCVCVPYDLLQYSIIFVLFSVLRSQVRVVLSSRQ